MKNNEVIIDTAQNGEHKIYLIDFTRTWEYHLRPEPERKEGQKYAQWKRQSELFKKTSHYNTPYWVQVEFWGDDDQIIQCEFAMMEQARECFEDVATAPEPDFSLFK